MAIAGETWGEVLWSIYFAMAKKDRNLNNLDPGEMVSYYDKGGKKMSGYIKDKGLSTQLRNINPQNIRDFDAMSRSQFSDKLIRLDWHGATKHQVTNFIKNPKVSFTASSNLTMTRQGEFYNLVGIEDYIKKVKAVFGYDFTADRWNPSDVWFYSEESVREIKKYISQSIINDSSIFSILPRRQQKVESLKSVVGLNDMILKLYQEKKLVPVSLKKASGSKGNYTDRIALINIPKNKNNLPKDPVVKNKEYPIRNDGVIGSRNLKYDIKSQDAVIEKDGNIIYKDKYDYVQTDDKGSTFKMPGRGEFSAAQGGSFGIKDAESVYYTAKGKRSIDEARNNAGFKNFPPQRKAYIMSKGLSIRSGYNDEQVSLAKQYADELCNILEPILKNSDKKYDKKLLSGNKTEKLRSIQNKLEIAVGIKESGIEDEIIIDIFNAIKSKSVINRRDYQKILDRISSSYLKKSKMKGQKRLTREEADRKAEIDLNSTSKIGPNFKLPSSFHLKLY